MTAHNITCPTCRAPGGHGCVEDGRPLAVPHPARGIAARLEALDGLTRPARRSWWREAQPDMTPAGSGWKRTR